MSATFAAPVAAVLLAVELLLFEWKPRSLVPVALASATAAAARRYLLGLGPIFPGACRIPPFIGPGGLAGCVASGLLAGVLSALLTRAVYASEDAFRRLPIHWMWWPAIGGVVIGVGGLIFPRALGVGYDTIGDLLQGDVAGRTILGILIVKAVIWAVSLGSGTSGGVLAPLLMMGGALGGVEAWVLPDRGAGFWPLVSMGAILGGTMRSPLTGVIFALELTHDVNMLLPLLDRVVHRARLHGAGAQALDPHREGRAPGLPPQPRVRDRSARDPVRARGDAGQHRGAPVGPSDPADPRVAACGSRCGSTTSLSGGRSAGRLEGVVTRVDLTQVSERAATGQPTNVHEVVHRKPAVAFPDEPLRVIVHRMAMSGLTRFPVVERGAGRRLVGVISLEDLLKARAQNLEAEHRRERILRVRIAFPFGLERTKV